MVVSSIVIAVLLSALLSALFFLLKLTSERRLHQRIVRHDVNNALTVAFLALKINRTKTIDVALTDIQSIVNGTRDQTGPFDVGRLAVMLARVLIGIQSRRMQIQMDIYPALVLGNDVDPIRTALVNLIKNAIESNTSEVLHIGVDAKQRRLWVRNRADPESCAVLQRGQAGESTGNGQGLGVRSARTALRRCGYHLQHHVQNNLVTAEIQF